MTDKILERFRYEFGDNQPDIDEFIQKVLEEICSLWGKETTADQKLLEAPETGLN